jgi:hypothetical protein
MIAEIWKGVNGRGCGNVDADSATVETAAFEDNRSHPEKSRGEGGKVKTRTL